MKRKSGIALMILLCGALLVIAACGKKQADTSATDIADKTAASDVDSDAKADAKQEIQQDLKQNTTKDEKASPAEEIKEECKDVKIELAPVNGKMYCVNLQTDFDIFYFGVKNTGKTNIDQLSLQLYGQGGSSVTSEVNEIELSSGTTKKLSVYFVSKTYGKLWKAEIAPRVPSKESSDKTIVCNNAKIVIDASILADKNLAVC